MKVVKVDEELYTLVRELATKNRRSMAKQISFMILEEPGKPKAKPKAKPMPKAEQNALIDSWLFYWEHTKGIIYLMNPKDYAAIKKIGNYLETLSPDDKEPETI
ncbi:unnamed protein product, partial [marine sediment metagenome]